MHYGLLEIIVDVRIYLYIQIPHFIHALILPILLYQLHYIPKPIYKYNHVLIYVYVLGASHEKPFLTRSDKSIIHV